MKYYISRNLAEMEVITHSYLYRSKDGEKVEILNDQDNGIIPSKEGWMEVNHNIKILKEIDQETLLNKCSELVYDDNYAVIIINEFKRLFYRDILDD